MGRGKGAEGGGKNASPCPCNSPGSFRGRDLAISVSREFRHGEEARLGGALSIYFDRLGSVQRKRCHVAIAIFPPPGAEEGGEIERKGIGTRKKSGRKQVIQAGDKGFEKRKKPPAPGPRTSIGVYKRMKEGWERRPWGKVKGGASTPDKVGGRAGREGRGIALSREIVVRKREMQALLCWT